MGTSGKHRKGKCGHCKQTGHLRKNCPNDSKKCKHCKLSGHMKKECWKLHPDQRPSYYKGPKDKDTTSPTTKADDLEDVLLTTIKMALPNNLKEFIMDEDLWGLNSGALLHMTPFKQGMYDVSKIKGKVYIGNGSAIEATHVGKKNFITEYKDGTMQNVMLKVK